MKGRRLVLVAAVLAITASVFYVTLSFFSTAQVVTYSDGSLSVSPGDLPVQLGSLVAFLVVSIVGLYATVRLLALPETRDHKGESDPYSSWRLYLHRLELPPFDDEDDED
ncbi:MAG: hypothetical protein ACOCRA_00655 [Halobacteria archaeon]